MKILKDQSAQTATRAVGLAYRLWLPFSINRVLNLTKLRSVIYIYIYIYIYNISLIFCTSFTLKAVAVAFLLDCFPSLKESTCETWKKVSYFNSKALFILKKSNFSILDNKIAWHHQMPKHKTRNTFLLNNLGSKHSLLMKFGQFMSDYKRKNFIKKFYKNCDLKTSSRFFCVCKELSTTSIGK